MPTIAELAILFTANDSGFQRTNTAVQRGLGQTSAAAEDTSTWLGLLERAIADLSDVERIAAGDTRTLTTELKSLGKAAAALDRTLDTGKIRAYATELGTLDGVGSALAVELAELEKVVGSLNRRFASQTPETYGQRALASSSSVDALALSATNAEAQILALNQQLAATRALLPRNINVNANSGAGGRGPRALNGSAAMQVGRTLTKDITMPLLAVGAASVVVETEFGAAMARIEALSGIGHQQVLSWSKDILKLGPEIGKMPIELAQGMFFVANEIKDSAKAMEVLRFAGGMSAIGMGKTEDDAKALVFVLHDYADSNLTAAKTADILTAATRVGNFSVETLTSNLGKLLPIASNMHIPFEQIAGAIAAMTKEGATVPQATTGIARLLQNVSKPPKDAQAAYKAMGTSAKEVAREMQTDLFGAIVKVKEAADAHHISLTRLFTTQNSWKAALAILGGDLKESRKDFDAVANSSGAFGKALSTTAQTDLFKYKQAMASLESAGISLGASLSPLIREIEGNIKYLSDQFSQLTPNSQRAIVLLLGVGAAAGPLTSTIGLLTKGVGLLQLSFNGLSTIGIVSKLGLVGIALAELLNLFRMGMDVIDGWNQKTEAANLASRQPVNTFSMTSATVDKVTPGGLWGLLPDQHEEITVPRQGYLEKRRQQEDDAARKDRSKWRMGPDGSQYFVGPVKREPEKQIYQEFLKTHVGKANAPFEYKQPQLPKGGFGLGDDAAGGGKPAKQSQAAKEQDQRLTSLNEKLVSLAQATRLYGNDSDAAAARDELLYGQFASDAAKAAGLAVALKQLTKAQVESAAHDIYGKSFEKLSASQKEGAEIVALSRLDEARKKSAEVAKGYAEILKNLNDEAHRAALAVLVSKAKTDEDAIALEKFGIPFAKLTPAKQSGVSALATARKNQKAAEYDPSEAQFNTGPNPQDARDALDADVRKANIGVLIAKSTSDEDAIALERYGKAYKDLTDPAIISGVRALADAQKNLQAAKYDPSGAKFSDGSELAAKMNTTYLEALHTLNKEISDVGKQTQAVRVATLEWDDAGAQMGRRMTHDQAEQLASLQMYLAKLKETKAATDEIAGKASSLLTGGAEHILDHGFKGIGNYFKTESKKDVQGMLLDNLQKQSQSWLSGLLGGKQQDKNAALVAAINTQIAALNANTSALGGTPAAGAGIGVGAGAVAGIPGVPSWVGSIVRSLSIPGFAGGGDYAGGPMWVGENGPEIINPRGSGTVIPNDRIGGDVHNHTHGPMNVHFHVQDSADFNSTTARQHAQRIKKSLKEHQ